MPDVRLVDLEVIRRYSLAIRQESADAAELLKALTEDRARVEKMLKAGRGTSTRKTKPSRSSAAKSTRAGSKAKGPK
ncbi:MAG TPA: hypothetical protein VI916_05640 [Acidimicrobiia bacterium]|nr:hypothetical protein [Acidimicrobiia bacterium]